VAIARGQGKISGKAKFAQILGLLCSDLFFGTTVAVGQFAVSQLEAATVPAVTPFTVANAASYSDDLGIVYAATGKRFNRVTTPSAAGQYSVNFATGVYTFSAADANAALLISYTYNVATSGNKLTLTNQLMGTTPTFKATFYTSYSGEGLASRLNACTANKLSIGRSTSSILWPSPTPRARSEHCRMMIPGVMVAMGGQQWTVPPLTLGQLPPANAQGTSADRNRLANGRDADRCSSRDRRRGAATELSRYDRRHGRESARSRQRRRCAECRLDRLGTEAAGARAGGSISPWAVLGAGMAVPASNPATPGDIYTGSSPPPVATAIP
jgi:hypothetical protein